MDSKDSVQYGISMKAGMYWAIHQKIYLILAIYQARSSRNCQATHKIELDCLTLI